MERCEIPPEGWICTRKQSHEGPCAAVKETKTLYDKILIELAYCRHVELSVSQTADRIIKLVYGTDDD